MNRNNFDHNWQIQARRCSVCVWPMLVTRIVRRSCFPFAYVSFWCLHYQSLSHMIAILEIIILSQDKERGVAMAWWYQQPWFIYKGWGPWCACSDTTCVCGNHSIYAITFTAMAHSPRCMKHTSALETWLIIKCYTRLFFDPTSIPFSSFVVYWVYYACHILSHNWMLLVAVVYRRAYNTIISIIHYHENRPPDAFQKNILRLT